MRKARVTFILPSVQPSVRAQCALASSIGSADLNESTIRGHAVSSRMKIKTHLRIVTCTLGLILLAACGDGVPEATDAQLLQLIGSKRDFMGASEPLSISKRTVECVRALSGVDDIVYKDMPAEMLGSFKTHCRKALSERIADSSKNPLGFKLESFENKELAERITALKASTDASNRIIAEKERARVKAETLAKMQAGLDAERKRYQAFIDSLDNRMAKAASRCEAWAASKSLAKAKDKYSQWSYRRAPDICQEQTLVQIRPLAKKNQEYLAKQKVNPDGFGMGFSKPYYGMASAAWFDEQEARLEKEVAQMKEVVSH